FPISLIMARGAELATTRTIGDLFNNAYAGARMDYHKIADELIRERFEDGSWDYEVVNKDGTVEKGKFTFEEAAPHFLLDTGDVTDALNVAQTALINMQMLEVAKKIGASRADIQMLADERDITNLDLEKFDDVGGAGMFGMQSTSEEDNPEISPDEDKLTKELIVAYNTAKKSIVNILD
ncbi:MAG: hypothetical protein KAJ19_29785, partial [Gammaproteobacteria bacterium]|nr:hypothetical protein [Gammaproteobacteria bacterium]